MSRLFPALGDKRSEPQPQPAPERKALDLTPQSIQNRPYRDEWSVDRAMRDGMARVTWVFRAIHIRATKSARLPLVMRQDNPYDGDEVDHPLLPLLNAFPNDEESAYVFRYRLSALVDLNRRGAFIELQRSRVGEVLAMRLLPCDTVPVPGSARLVNHFDVMVAGRKAGELAPENVVWVKHPHPTDPYSGMTPLEAAGIAIDTEWAAKLYQRNFLHNNASLGGFILLGGDVGNLQEVQAKIDARSGPRNAGRWMAVEASQTDNEGNATGAVGGVNVVPAAATPKDADYIEMRKYSREEIFGAFGVPISIGSANAADRIRENANVEELGFWRHTMVDHCDMLDRPFDRVDGDPTTFLSHDFSSVWVLQLDRIDRENHLIELRKDGDITRNELREEIGRDPYKTGGDDVFEPVTYYPVASTSRDSGVSTSGSKMFERKDADASDRVEWGRWNVNAKRLSARRSERLRQIVSWEKQTKRIVSGFFDRQERAVVEKLRGRKAREGTRHWRTEVSVDGKTLAGVAGGDGSKVISASDIFDRARWDEQITADLSGVLLAVAQHFGSDTYDTLASTHKAAETKADSGYDETSPRLLAFIQARGNKITGINDTTFDDIASALAEGEDAGETMDELAVRVAGVFESARGQRAETIARTEVISAANAGSVDAMQQSGVVATKAWLSSSDDRVRDTHSEADGQEVGLDEPFIVGGEELDYPGDPNGSPELTVNCRCTVTGVTEEGPAL